MRVRVLEEGVSKPRGGMARRELDRLLIALGGTVEIRNRTGEVAYRHPLVQGQATANSRLKDATWALAHFVRAVQHAIDANRKE